MNINDAVMVWCYRGYRPAFVKAIGKRKVQVTFPGGITEWVKNKRVFVPNNLKDQSHAERTFKESEYYLLDKEK